jgi:D-threonate/D-erythronate kinase
MNSVQCLLIADDLTGACDAAAPFAARGHHTVVLPSHVAAYVGQASSPAADLQVRPNAEVVSISTDTRDRPPAEIRRAIDAAARRFSATAPRILFKKIDSTLRGNPAAEIAAARDAFACRTVVVCPAFPAMNRIVESGFLKVTTDRSFAPLDIRTKAGDGHHVPLDAACDADLDRIVAAAFEPPVLWAGSAGLAAALARSLPPGPCRPPEAGRAAPVVFCIGSDHPVTRRQLATLLASDAAHLLLRVQLQDPVDALAANIAAARPGALVLSGGDTAALVCRALGVDAIDHCAELIPGIPRGVLRGGTLDGTPVVTKSGGFGAPDSLLRIAEFFSCPNLLTTAP